MSDFFKKSEKEQAAKLKNMYLKNDMSTVVIAKELGTYSKRIERALKKYGIPLRSRSEAQKNALATGTTKHPTKGTERSLETKKKIAGGIAKSWAKISAKEMKRRSKISSERYKNLSEEEKEELHRKSREALKEAAIHGSKLENYLANALEENGFVVETHRKHAIADSKLHLDIVLPEKMIAVEIDGVSHSENIYGIKDLMRTKNADTKKNGLLIENGYTLIRVKQEKSFSLSYAEKLAKKLLSTIKSLDNSEPKIVRI